MNALAAILWKHIGIAAAPLPAWHPAAPRFFEINHRLAEKASRNGRASFFVGDLFDLLDRRSFMTNQLDGSVFRSEFGFPFVMVVMIFGCFLYFATGYFAAISVASAITSAYCAFLAFVLVKNMDINLIRMQVYLSAVAYFFPLSYLGLVDNVGLLESTNDELAACAIMIVVSISIGWCFSFIFRFNATLPRDTSPFLRPSDVALLVGPIFLYQFVMMATGKWSYATTHEAFLGNEEPISPWIMVSSVTFGIGPLVAYNYGLLRSAAERTWLQFFLTTAVVALGTVFWMIEGRRSMATFLILSAVAFFFGRTKCQFTLKQVLAAGLVFLVIGVGMIQGSKFFYSMRLTAELLGRQRTLSMSIPEFIEYSRKIQELPIAAEVVKAQTSRPFIIDNAAWLLRYLNHHLYGKELALEFISSIPSALFPGKAAFTQNVGTMEDLWNKEYGMPWNDYANSYTLDGYVDFWYFGFFVYCLASALCLQLAYRLYSLSPALTYFCLFNNLMIYVQVENSIASSVVYLRTMVMLLVPLAIGYSIVEAGTRLRAAAKVPLLRRLQISGRWASSPLKPDLPK